MMDPMLLFQALAALDDEMATRIISQTLRNRPELAPGVVNAAVPDLTYAPAEALTKRRSMGVIKSFSPTGFGFISCPELKAVFGHDVYVHKNQMGLLRPGAEVNFAVLLSKDMKPQAFDLQQNVGVQGGGCSPCCGGCGGCGGCSPCGGCVGCGGCGGCGPCGGDSSFGCGGCGGACGGACGGCGGCGGCAGGGCSGSGCADPWGCGGAPGCGMCSLPDIGGMGGMGGMGGTGMGGCGMGNMMGNIVGMMGEMMGNKGKGWGKGGAEGACGGVSTNCCTGSEAQAPAKRMRAASPPEPRPEQSQIIGQFKGTIKSFDAKNGFGFIESQGLKDAGYPNDVFLHRNQINEFQPGMEVTFTAYLNKKGQPQSMDLAPVKPGAPSST